MEDIRTEVHILQLKLQSLKDIASSSRPSGQYHDSDLGLFDRARLLQTECELRERAMIDAGKDRKELKMHIITGLSSLSLVSIREHIDRNDEVFRLNQASTCLSFRCSEPRCYHYIYGFSSLASLEKHLVDAHAKPTPTIVTANATQESTTSSEVSITPTTNPPEADDTDFIHVSFESGAPGKRRRLTQSRTERKMKKKSALRGERLSKEKTPCLRCKVLKKQCDGATPCQQCPQQDKQAKGDYWKVLGCLKDTDTLLRNFFTASCCTQAFRVPHVSSLQACKSDSETLSALWLDQNITTVLSEMDKFVSWKNHQPIGAWEDETGLFRRALEDQMSSLKHVECYFEIVHIIEWSPEAWSAFLLQRQPIPGRNFQTLSFESVALESCIFSYYFGAITLAQLNDSTRENAVNTCFICNAAKPSSHIDLNNQANTIRLINDSTQAQLWYDLQEVLNIYLSVLVRSCLRRNGLSSIEWLENFRDLYLLAILKSVLIDVQVNGHASDSNSTVVAQIESAYNALVSLFIWASKSDPLGRPESSPNWNDLNSEDRGWLEIKKMVQHEKWKERGIKSTKDFLLGLGSGFYNDGTYKGYYIQRYGLEEHLKARDRSASKHSMPQAVNISAISKMQRSASISSDSEDSGLPLPGAESSTVEAFFSAAETLYYMPVKAPAAMRQLPTSSIENSAPTYKISVEKGPDVAGREEDSVFSRTYPGDSNQSQALGTNGVPQTRRSDRSLSDALSDVRWNPDLPIWSGAPRSQSISQMPPPAPSFFSSSAYAGYLRNGMW